MLMKTVHGMLMIDLLTPVKKVLNYWTLKEVIKGNKLWLFVLSLDRGSLIAIVKVHAFKF